MYTRAQEKALGLTPREKIGTAWTDVSVLQFGEIDHEDYPQNVVKHLGVRSQVALSRMMEEGWSGGDDGYGAGESEVDFSDPVLFPRRAAARMRKELRENGHSYELETLASGQDTALAAYLMGSNGSRDA